MTATNWHAKCNGECNPRFWNQTGKRGDEHCPPPDRNSSARSASASSRPPARCGFIRHGRTPSLRESRKSALDGFAPGLPILRDARFSPVCLISLL